MRSDLRALLYLQQRLILGWLRRSMRSPAFWVLAGFLALVLVSQLVTILQGTVAGDIGGWVRDEYINAIAAIVTLASIVIGLWRGTSRPPSAALSDVVIMMGSPISSRLQFSYLMARPIVTNAVVLGFWTVLAAGGVSIQADDPWIQVRIFFCMAVAVGLSELLRFAVWVTTEQVVARSPMPGRRLRAGVRAVAAGLVVLVGVRVLGPVAAANVDSWREALDVIIGRADQLAEYPPMSLMVGVLTPGGSATLDALGLVLICVVVGAVAVLSAHARHFIEPISIEAERGTDPRGHVVEAGADVQWAALTQVGVAPRLTLSLPPFASGAWALLWAGLVRWIRYQLASAWMSLVIYVIFGVAAGLGVHLAFVPVEVAWMVVLSFPFFGSVNMFLDEMRKPFIFLVPGSAGKRLLAGALPSILDGFSAAVLLSPILVLMGAIPFIHGVGLIVLSAAIALLAQGSVAAVQIVLPYWMSYRVRVSLTFGLTALAFTPSLIVLIVTYLLISPVPALLASAVVTVIAGALMLLLAAIMFDRIEFSG